MQKSTRKKAAQSKEPGQRQLRVGEEVRHALVDVFSQAHFHHPNLRELSVTISEVRMSPDLKNASVFISPLGREGDKEFLFSLSQATPFIRKEMARRLNLRNVPRLRFVLDTSFAEASHIDSLLRREKVRADLEKQTEEEPGTKDSDDDHGGERS